MTRTSPSGSRRTLWVSPPPPQTKAESGDPIKRFVYYIRYCKCFKIDFLVYVRVMLFDKPSSIFCVMIFWPTARESITYQYSINCICNLY